ncbi:MAG TPA: hypothetical protein VF798_14855 [Burkholderiaceae bacterium]
MLIFIDTEFTDFRNPQLISIALVSDCGEHEFYAELRYDRERCNDFVVETVLPLLGEPAGAVCESHELTQRLSIWLAQFEGRGEVAICYDFGGDWRFFCAALGGAVPTWIVPRNIFNYLVKEKLEAYFSGREHLSHHALHDARANRHAFDSEKAARQSARFRKSR